MINKSCLIFIVLILFAKCTAPNISLYPPSGDNPDNKKIYIIKYRWHTGITFNREEALPYLASLNNDFQNAEYLEAGWGDLDFYTADRGTFPLALKAVLWPTKSALRVAGYNKHPSLIFGESRITEIVLSEQGFINIIQYINKSFALDSNSMNIKIKKETSGPGQFYLSKEKYHGFKTCNVWTAKAIRSTGFPITPFFALTSKKLIKQIERNENKFY
jgi:uncharacterized protein (TIGR02117 family)